MNPSVSIVIPSWNGLNLLKRFLPSVIAAAARYRRDSGAETEILIVDDGSSDQTVEWLASEGFSCADDHAQLAPLAPRKEASNNNSAALEGPERRGLGDEAGTTLRVLKNEANLGFGESCNRGIGAAEHRLVFLLNNDVEVDPDSIAPLAENFASPDVFAAHSRVFEFESGRLCGTGKLGGFSSGFIRVHRSYEPVGEAGSRAASPPGDNQANHTGDLYSMFASGGSSMFDRRKFIEVGGFEHLLNPFYWEDVELSYRAWKRGYSVVYEPRSVARHRVSSTMRRIDQAKVRRTQQRNRLIFHWINLHDGRFIAYHVAWVVFLTLTSPLRFQPGYARAVFSALGRLSDIRKRRRAEKRLSKRSDREVFALFESFAARPDIFCYDDYKELESAVNDAGLVAAKK